MTRVKITAFISLSLLLLILVAIAGGLYGRFSQTNERRMTQAAFNAKLTAVATDDCLEIEKLKKNQRDIAIQNYENLNATLKLLSIRRTPAIVEAAKKAKREALVRFAPAACPRKAPIKGGRS